MQNVNLKTPVRLTQISVAPTKITMISYVLKHRIIRDRATGDIIELRYLVLIDIDEGKGMITRYLRFDKVARLLDLLRFYALRRKRQL
jgi:hypothetical protein